MAAIKTGYITTCQRNTIMMKVKEAAGYSGLPSNSPSSPAKPDMDTSTWHFGGTGTLGQTLTLGGTVDLAIEVIADKLNVADA